MRDPQAYLSGLDVVLAVMVALSLSSCTRREDSAETLLDRAVTKVVLITIDTLRTERLGCYGYREKPTSPTIDAWAEDAVVFERAVAQAPWTVPSLGSLMTGFYPVEAGVYTNRAHLHPGLVTLAQLFQEHGFATASFNTHYLLLGEYGGFRNGFDDVFPRRIPAQKDERIHKIPFSLVEPDLMAWLEAHAKDRFFIWIHDMSPHEPRTKGNTYFKQPEWRRHDDWRNYDPEVRWTDDIVGRIFAKLREIGIWEQVLIVFTADHGEAFFEHGLIGHQDVIYDEVLRVPLIIQYPAVRPGRVAAQVELLDLFRTIAELSGIPVPDGVRGESLVPLMDGRAARRHRRFLYHARYHFEHGEHHLAVRDNEWKLIVKTPPVDTSVDERPDWGLHAPGTTFELYNLLRDPGETSNVVAADTEVALGLEGALWAWRKMTAEQATVDPAPERREPDAATEEALRALGYGR